jgi:hypothetical protein
VPAELADHPRYRVLALVGQARFTQTKDSRYLRIG